MMFGSTANSAYRSIFVRLGLATTNVERRHDGIDTGNLTPLVGQGLFNKWSLGLLGKL